MKAGVPGEQDGSGHFEIHNTAEDMLDKVDPAQSRLTVPAQAAVCPETTGAPELLGRK